jgi:hypothetical protein
MKYPEIIYDAVLKVEENQEEVELKGTHQLVLVMYW